MTGKSGRLGCSILTLARTAGQFALGIRMTGASAVFGIRYPILGEPARHTATACAPPHHVFVSTGYLRRVRCACRPPQRPHLARFSRRYRLLEDVGRPCRLPSSASFPSKGKRNSASRISFLISPRRPNLCNSRRNVPAIAIGCTSTSDCFSISAYPITTA